MTSNIHKRAAPEFIFRLLQPKDWAATIIAVLALAVSIWSGVVEREHQVLGERPHLFIAELFAPSSTRHGLVIFNYGLGMGFIDAFQLSLDGHPLSGSWDEQWKVFRTATALEDWTDRGGFSAGDPIAPNVSHEAEILLIVNESKFKPLIEPAWSVLGSKLRSAVMRLKISITYHSVYGEVFRIEKTALEPQQVFRRNIFGGFEAWKE